MNVPVPSAPQPPATTAIDPAARLTYRHRTGSLGGVTVAAGSVWVTATVEAPPMRGELLRLDPATLQPTGTTALADYPSDVAVAANRAWVLTMSQVQYRKVVAVDVDTGQVLNETELPGTVRRGRQENVELAAGAGGVWVVLPEHVTGEHRAVRLDPLTAEVVATVPLPAPPSAIAVGATVWVGLQDGRLLRIDSRLNRIVAEVSLGEEILDVSVDGESLWTSVRTSGTAVELLRLDADSGELAARTGVPVSTVVAAQDDVWVANYGYSPPAHTGFVGELDTARNGIGRSTSIPTVLGNGVSSLALGEGAVWILSRPTSTLIGVRTAR